MSEGTARLDGENGVWALVGDDAAIIAAISATPPPAQVDLLLNGDPSAAVRAATVSWPLTRHHEDPAYGWLAVFPFRADRQDSLTSVLVRARRNSSLYLLLAAPAPLQVIAAAVAAEKSPGLSSALDSFLDILAAQRSSGRQAAASAFVWAAAESAGYVELIGGEAGELFLQGWATDLPTGRLQVIASVGHARACEFSCGRFERSDLADGAYGFAGILQLPPEIGPDRVAQLAYRSSGGWRKLERYERCTIVPPRETPSHARAILSRITATRAVIDRLLCAAHRFDGRDTVSSLDVPVRIGVDTVVRADSSVLAAGWLLDPLGLVKQVGLCVSGEMVTVNDSWTRQSRPDVTAAFSQDPLFSRLDTTRHGHGFLAFASRAAGGNSDETYFELRFEDRPPAHFPVRVENLPVRRTLARLARSFDPKSVTAAAAIEQQLAPMLRSLPRPAPHVEVRDFGFPKEAPLAIVIGADRRLADVTALLALLALDPDTRGLPIVVAAPNLAVMEVGEEIRRISEFYRLSVRLVGADPIEDVYDAMEAGAAASTARTLVLLSAHVVPGAQGWFSALTAAFRQRRERMIISPTILFDDGSIRWAGNQIQDRQGTRTLVNRFAGLSWHLVEGAEPVEVTTAALDCCVVSRSAFEAAKGFSGSYIGPLQKAADMALRIRLCGTPSLWLPSVKMFGIDPPPDDDAYATPMVDRLDRWCFDREWALALSNLTS
jgi:hypothetical protein